MSRCTPLLVALALTLTACSKSGSSTAARPAVTLAVTTLTATPPTTITAPAAIPVPSVIATPTATATPTPAPTPSPIRTANWERVVAAELRLDGSPGSVTLGDVIYADLTGDGDEEAVVPVSSEGTAGIIGYYVFTARGGQLLRLLVRRAPQLTVDVEGGRLVEATPLYAAGDPRCCPSQLKRTTFRWTGTALEPAMTETVPNPNR